MTNYTNFAADLFLVAGAAFGVYCLGIMLKDFVSWVRRRRNVTLG